MPGPQPQLRIALIGSGFMGRAHAMAFQAAARTFDLGVTPVLEIIADRDETAATEARAALGFRRATGDWRQAVTDPNVDLVAIATPNILHAPVALAAMDAGKAIYCEKPLATTLEEGGAMVRRAEATRSPTAVGFTYCFNPMISLALDIVSSGEIGEVTSFRGIHAEDFMCSPEAPFNWRCEPENVGGALADLGSHIIALAQHLVGSIVEVGATLATIHGSRRDVRGELRQVTVDDMADAWIRFESGATGALSASWLSTGRKMGLRFEISGTKGALYFTQERLNELQLFRKAPVREEGFMTICAGPSHGDYAAFCPAPGHQLGYNDLKTIEAKSAIDAALRRPNRAKTLRDAFAVDVVAEAMRISSIEKTAIEVQALAS